MSLSNFILLASALTTLSLLLFETQKQKTGVWITKPLASTGFVLYAYFLNASHSTAGKILLLALIFCWLGDVLLIPDSKKIFKTGVFAFLLGHFAFIALFIFLGFEKIYFATALAVFLGVGIFIYRWLIPKVQASTPSLVFPVKFYLGVVSLMVCFAASTAGLFSKPTLFAGALLFYLSDLSVALDRFVNPAGYHKLWGLPLYYSAQFILVMGVVG